MTYEEFIVSKSQLNVGDGFEPLWMPDFLFPFQQSLTDWSIRKGRSAIFADCGLGKTPMQLVWAQNVVEKTNRPVRARAAGKRIGRPPLVLDLARARQLRNDPKHPMSYRQIAKELHISLGRLHQAMQQPVQKVSPANY